MKEQGEKKRKKAEEIRADDARGAFVKINKKRVSQPWFLLLLAFLLLSVTPDGYDEELL